MCSWNVLYTNQKRKKNKNWSEGCVKLNNKKLSLYSDLECRNYLDSKFVGTLVIYDDLEIETDSYLINIQSEINNDQSNSTTTNNSNIQTIAPISKPKPISSKIKKGFTVPTKPKQQQPPPSSVHRQQHHQQRDYYQLEEEEEEVELIQKQQNSVRLQTQPDQQKLKLQTNLEEQQQPKKYSNEIDSKISNQKSSNSNREQPISLKLPQKDSNISPQSRTPKQPTPPPIEMKKDLKDKGEIDNLDFNSEISDDESRSSFNNSNKITEINNQDFEEKDTFDSFHPQNFCNNNIEEDEEEEDPFFSNNIDSNSISNQPIENKIEDVYEKEDDLLFLDEFNNNSENIEKVDNNSKKNLSQNTIKSNDNNNNSTLKLSPLKPTNNSIKSSNLTLNPPKNKNSLPPPSPITTNDKKKITNSFIVPSKRKLEPSNIEKSTSQPAKQLKSTGFQSPQNSPSISLSNWKHGTIFFPDARLAMTLNSKGNVERNCFIFNKFKSIEEYQSNLIEAINEDLNIKLLEIAYTFYQTSLSLKNSSNNPSCKHGPTKKLLVRNGQNKGREYYACALPNGKPGKCGFIDFVKESDSSKSLIFTDSRSVILSDDQILPETELFFQNRGIKLYLYTKLIVTMNQPQQQNNNSYQQQQQPPPQATYYFEFVQKKGQLYSKDDIWILSLTMDFSKDNFLMKSVYHGPSKNNFIELKPIGMLPSNLSKCNKVYSIQGPNSSNELLMIENLISNDNLIKLPILPFVLDPELPNRKISIVTQEEIDNTFFINLKYSEGLSIANEFINGYHLNVDQKNVLLSCLRWFNFQDTDPNDHQYSISNRDAILVHGVFGSGKSTLLVVIIMFIVTLCERGDNDMIKIMVSSLTNVAVDRILLGLLEKGFTHFNRVGSVKRIAKPILLYTVHGSRSGPGGGISTDSDDVEAKKELLKMLKTETLSEEDKSIILKTIKSIEMGLMKNLRKDLKNCKVVGATCISSTFSILNDHEFPIVFLDECSQMQEPLSMLPVTRSKCQKMLVVGDPLQLEPTIQSKPSQNVLNSGGGLEKTLFVRLANSNVKPIILRTQYRCHPTISGLSNKLFYNGVLFDGISDMERPSLIPNLPPVVCCDAENGSEILDNGGSYYNEMESDIVLTMIEILLSKGVTDNQIGVICLYKAQASKITNLLDKKYKTIESNNNDDKKNNKTKDQDFDDYDNYNDDDIDEQPFQSDEDIEDFFNDKEDGEYSPKRIKKKSSVNIQVSTVDAFQGAEKDVILLSCSRTTSAGGFIDNPQRLNVAITRAKNHFIIIGKPHILKSHITWNTILQSSKLISGKK
eukprot:gene7602-9347_t